MKFDWKAGLGITFSGVLLWWTLRGVDLREVWTVLRTSNVSLFVLSAVVGTCIFPLRARRWRTILEPVAGTIPFDPLWRSTAIGMMMNNVFPFRAGEFARAFALARDVPRVPMTTALGPLAVDPPFDAMALVFLIFAAMPDPPFPAWAEVGGHTGPVISTVGGV